MLGTIEAMKTKTAKEKQRSIIFSEGLFVRNKMLGCEQFGTKAGKGCPGNSRSH